MVTGHRHGSFLTYFLGAQRPKTIALLTIEKYYTMVDNNYKQDSLIVYAKMFKSAYFRCSI